MLLTSCAQDIIDLTGSVSGVVYDKSTQKPVEGCIVGIQPTSNEIMTTSSGTYVFNEIEAGNYNLTFDKDGYEKQSKNVEIVPNQMQNLNIFLNPIEEKISTNAETLNFGDLLSEKELIISTSASTPTTFSVKSDADWIIVNPNSGTLSNKGQIIKVVVDRTKISVGSYSKKITISTQKASVEIPVLVTKVELSAPSVSNNGDFYDITENSCKVDGLISGTGGSPIFSHGHCWSKNENPTIADKKTDLGNTSEIGKFTSTLTQLQSGEVYYVRAYATNSIGIQYSKQLILKIPEITTPKIETQPATDITKTSATINAHLDSDGGSEVVEQGFYYGTTENPSTRKIVTSETNKTQLKLVLSGLKDGQKYYYKAFAKNKKGEGCGQVMSFTTLNDNTPTVSTIEAINITSSSATLKGKILDKGSSDIIECGFYYGTTSNPTTKKQLSNTSSTDLSLVLTGLKDETTYYYKAYARNSKGETCGDVVSFRTSAEIAPTVVTSSATNIGTDRSTLHGQITDKGSSDIIECGFYYGTTSNPTTKKSLSSNSNTDLVLVLTSLKDETTYYYKAYARNAKGETCGDIMLFSTEKERVPEVVTYNAENVSYKSATIVGEIVDKGTTSVTECGFYYGTNSDPSIREKVNVPSGGTGMIQMKLPNIVPGETYYYKAFARNEKGYAYGTTKSVTIPKLPSVNNVSFEPLEDLNEYSGYNSASSYQLKGTATIDPQGYNIVETGIIWMGHDTYYDHYTNPSGELDYTFVKRNATLFSSMGYGQCTRSGNKITINNKIYIRQGNTKGIYARVYIILEDNTIVQGDIFYITPTSSTFFKK